MTSWHHGMDRVGGRRMNSKATWLEVNTELGTSINKSVLTRDSTYCHEEESHFHGALSGKSSDQQASMLAGMLPRLLEACPNKLPLTSTVAVVLKTAMSRYIAMMSGWHDTTEYKMAFYWFVWQKLFELITARFLQVVGDLRNLHF